MKGDLGHDKHLTEGNPQKMEMRAMLEDPIGQKYIGQFAKKVMTQVKITESSLNQRTSINLLLRAGKRDHLVSSPCRRGGW